MFQMLISNKQEVVNYMVWIETILEEVQTAPELFLRQILVLLPSKYLDCARLYGRKPSHAPHAPHPSHAPKAQVPQSRPVGRRVRKYLFYSVTNISLSNRKLCNFTLLLVKYIIASLLCQGE